MAAKKQRKPKADSPGQIEIEIKVAPEVTENTPFYYSNYISVSNSPYDFTLTLVRLPTSLTPEQKEIAKKGKRVPIEAALQIIFSPQLISGLIDALSKQKNNYEARFGKIEKEKKLR